MSEKKPKKKKDCDKYPFLYKRKSARVKMDYVETEDYINGVKDPDSGKLVIPALDDDTKAWLNKFNAEFIHGNVEGDYRDLHPKDVYKDTDLYNQNNEKTRDTYNQTKATGLLLTFETQDFDNLTLKNSVVNDNLSIEDYLDFDQNPVEFLKTINKKDEKELVKEYDYYKKYNELSRCYDFFSSLQCEMIEYLEELSEFYKTVNNRNNRN